MNRSIDTVARATHDNSRVKIVSVRAPGFYGVEYLDGPMQGRISTLAEGDLIDEVVKEQPVKCWETPAGGWGTPPKG